MAGRATRTPYVGLSGRRHKGLVVLRQFFAYVMELLTRIGTPVYAEGSPAALDEKAHLFCKADPSAVDMHPLFNDPRFRMGLGKLISAASVEGRVICLMCGCLRPHKCHRSRLIGEALIAEGVEVLHLDDQGRPVPQQQVVIESQPQQTSLF